ncbi:MAG TPA: MauE/DoxX family redox-associated membrane protein [Solirubrobacteraceae bacterium]
MANALTVPHAVAAAVLCVAGLAKLHAPAPAARAVGAVPAAVRAFALLELALGVWALLSAGRLSSALMAALYGAFAGLTIALWRRGRSCGCFGSERAPASPIQSLVSGALALLGAVCAVASVHPVAWISGRSPGSVAVLVLGISAAVYGTVLAYSELPLLWQSWRPAA